MARIFSPEAHPATPFVQLVAANGKLQVFPLSLLGPIFEVAEVGPLKMSGYNVWVMTGAQVAQLEVYKGEGDSLIKALGGDVPK